MIPEPSEVFPARFPAAAAAGSSVTRFGANGTCEITRKVCMASRDRSDHVIGQNLEVDLKISSEYSTILQIFR